MSKNHAELCEGMGPWNPIYNNAVEYIKVENLFVQR